MKCSNPLSAGSYPAIPTCRNPRKRRFQGTEEKMKIEQVKEWKFGYSAEFRHVYQIWTLSLRR